MALNSNNEEVYTLLLKLDYNCIFDKDKEGWTALHIVIIKRKF